MTLPRTLQFHSGPAKNLRIINCAYRRRPPVPQGGPAGVQRLTEDLFGGTYRGYHLNYFYEATSNKTSEIRVTEENLKLSSMTVKNLIACEELSSAIPRTFNNTYYDSCLSSGGTYYFVCHDVGCALAAQQAGFPYCLIYHQQGALAFELTAAGNPLSEGDLKLLNTIERLAFINADKVYFPSLGAQQVFFETTTSLKRQEVNLSENALYNTVAEFDVDPELARTYLAAHGYVKLMSEEGRKKHRILISVGDYNESKGMERVFDFACELQKKIAKKVIWISIGRANQSGIHSLIKKRAAEAEIESLIIGDRLPHETVMSLIDFSDQFVMLQRRSIFDFSTLEAMSIGKSVVLSPVGGNLEFNQDSNILFFDPDASNKERSDQISKIAKLDVAANGKANKQVFENSFSHDSFQKRYAELFDTIIETQIKPKFLPGISQETASKALEVFAGKDVVIVGPGSSARKINSWETEGAVLVALNSALGQTLNLPFDVHMMQDEPADPRAWHEYWAHDVIRFYGIVNNAASQKLKIDFDFAEKLCDSIYKYHLSPIRFDTRVDDFHLDFEKRPFMDMQSIVFSAIQLCAWAGAHSIRLAGIDFSTKNYDGANPNKYSSNLGANLEIVVRNLRSRGMNFDVLHSDSAFINGVFSESETDTDLERMSQFRVLQSYHNKKRFADGLNYFTENCKTHWMQEPRFMREVAQIHQGLGNYEEAIYFFERFFILGGESAECKKNLDICRSKQNVDA